MLCEGQICIVVGKWVGEVISHDMSCFDVLKNGRCQNLKFRMRLKKLRGTSNSAF
jgi:hypothetical protein